VATASTATGIWFPGQKDSGGLAGGAKGSTPVATATPSGVAGGNGTYKVTSGISYYEGGGGGAGWGGGKGGSGKTECAGSGGSSWIAGALPGTVKIGSPTVGANTCAVTATSTSPNECSGTISISTQLPGSVTMVAQKSTGVYQTKWTT
jgi:hypothetical protein